MATRLHMLGPGTRVRDPKRWADQNRRPRYGWAFGFSGFPGRAELFSARGPLLQFPVSNTRWSDWPGPDAQLAGGAVAPGPTPNVAVTLALVGRLVGPGRACAEPSFGSSRPPPPPPLSVVSALGAGKALCPRARDAPRTRAGRPRRVSPVRAFLARSHPGPPARPRPAAPAPSGRPRRVPVTSSRAGLPPSWEPRGEGGGGGRSAVELATRSPWPLGPHGGAFLTLAHRALPQTPGPAGLRFPFSSLRLLRLCCPKPWGWPVSPVVSPRGRGGTAAETRSHAGRGAGGGRGLHPQPSPGAAARTGSGLPAGFCLRSRPRGGAGPRGPVLARRLSCQGPLTLPRPRSPHGEV